MSMAVECSRGSELRAKLRTLALCFVAGSCAVAPERTYELDAARDLDVPERWQSLKGSAGDSAESSEQAQQGDWWDDFGDAGLDAAIAEALEHNRDLQAAAARLDAARALAEIAWGERLPELSLNTGATRQRQNFVGFPFPGAPGEDVITEQSTAYTATLDFRWELDLWGRLAAGEKAALADLRASQADLAGARLSLAGRVAKAWFLLIEAREQVELAQRTASTYRTNADFVRRRYQEGRSQPLDLRLLETELAGAEALLEARREQYERALRLLEILLGRYPSGRAQPGAELPPIPAEVPAGLPAELLLRRPDLVAAQERLAAADLRLYQARAALYPSLSLTARGGRQSEELDDLLDSDFDIWNVAGNLTQPLFQGGRLLSQVDLSDARVREVLEDLEQRILTAFSEVETQLVIEGFLTRREGFLREASDQATAARDLAKDRYASGLANVITVLVAERQALSSQAALLTARRERLDARIDLHLALGGGFDVREGGREDSEEEEVEP